MIELVPRFPVLSSRVGKAWTNKPVLESVPLSEETIAQRVTSKTFTTSAKQDAVQAIFQECLPWGVSFDPETGNLLRIGRLLNETTGETSIVLAIDHILSDGRGSLNLMPYILQPDLAPSTSDGALPPSLEERVNVKPAMSTLLKVIFQALILPRLPTWLVPRSILPTTFWPYKPLAGDIDSYSKAISPLEAEVGILVGDWKAEQVAQLSSIFSSPSSPVTLHAILSACSMATLWIIDSQSESEPQKSALNVKLTTPTSERNPALGHPAILGNYVGIVDTELTLNAASDVLQIARRYSLQVRQAKASGSTPTSWGLLDYIDDPDTLNEGGSDLTGWDTFFLEKAASKTPFSGSLEVSNVGLAPEVDATIQKQIKSFYWMQTPTGVGAAININVVGCRSMDSSSKFGDINFSLTWRKDSAPDGKLNAEHVNEYKKVLESLPKAIVKLHEANVPCILLALRDCVGRL